MEKEVNERLKNFRESVYLNQQEFANMLNIRQSYYSEIETGKRRIGQKLINKLREVYSISGDWLITGKGDIFFGKNEDSRTPDNVPTLSPPDDLLDKLDLFNYYKTLNLSELDYRLVEVKKELKKIYECYNALLETLHSINATDWLTEKFPQARPFEKYIAECEYDFWFINQDKKILNETELKALKIIDLYEDAKDNIIDKMWKLTNYMNSAAKAKSLLKPAKKLPLSDNKAE